MSRRMAPVRVIDAFVNGLDDPRDLVKLYLYLALGDEHQAIQSNAAGRSKWDPDAKMVRLVDIERFAAECVNPPPGIKSADWIAQGFPGAKCE